MSDLRFACVLAIVLAGACTSGPPPPPTDERPYEQRVQASRTEKDAAFRARDDSPIPASARRSFAGLPYFAIDPAYRVPAVLTMDPAARAVVIEMSTSSTELRRMRKARPTRSRPSSTPTRPTCGASSCRSAI
jgi:uncharacterized protein (DUF1684 family)